MSNYGKSTFDMDGNLVALLCYLGNVVCFFGLILSIITIVQDKSNRLARFHAWQSILNSVFGVVYLFVISILFFITITLDAMMGIAIFTPLLGLAVTIFGVVWFVLIIVTAVKAYGGEEYHMPIIGNIAERYV